MEKRYIGDKDEININKIISTKRYPEDKEEAILILKKIRNHDYSPEELKPITLYLLTLLGGYEPEEINSTFEEIQGFLEGKIDSKIKAA